jgi:hypothetical protein
MQLLTQPQMTPLYMPIRHPLEMLLLGFKSYSVNSH